MIGFFSGKDNLTAESNIKALVIALEYLDSPEKTDRL